MRRIYPDVDLTLIYNGSLVSGSFVTRLRKQHPETKQYYFWDFSLKCTFAEGISQENDLLFWISRCYNEVYRAMILGIVDSRIIRPGTDTPMFELDPDQTPEQERLRDIIIPK